VERQKGLTCVGVTLDVVYTVLMGEVVAVLRVRGGVKLQQWALRRALECQPHNIATVGLTKSLVAVTLLITRNPHGQCRTDCSANSPKKRRSTKVKMERPTRMKVERLSGDAAPRGGAEVHFLWIVMTFCVL